MGVEVYPPDHYRLLAQVAYNTKDPEAEIEHFLPGFEILEKATIGYVQLLLIRAPDSKMIVAFQGTSSVIHWIDNFATLGGKKVLDRILGGVRPKMETRISLWVEKYGQKIDMFVGHSKGGLYAHNVHPEWQDPIRVSFNALNARQGEAHFPLRLPKDPVSMSPLSHKNRYITCKDGGTGHYLIGFRKALEAKNWNDVQKNKEKYEGKECRSCTLTAPGVFGSIRSSFKNIFKKKKKEEYPKDKDGKIFCGVCGCTEGICERHWHPEDVEKAEKMFDEAVEEGEKHVKKSEKKKIIDAEEQRETAEKQM